MTEDIKLLYREGGKQCIAVVAAGSSFAQADCEDETHFRVPVKNGMRWTALIAAMSGLAAYRRRRAAFTSAQKAG